MSKVLRDHVKHINSNKSAVMSITRTSLSPPTIQADETELTQVSPSQAKSTQPTAPRYTILKNDMHQSSTEGNCMHQSGADEDYTHQSSTDEDCMHQSGADEDYMHQPSADEDYTHQSGTDEDYMYQSSTDEDYMHQSGNDEDNPHQSSIDAH
jgi:hypothetical protein